VRLTHLFILGRWEEALQLADAFIAECEAGRRHVQEGTARLVRAVIRVARDDTDGADSDIREALAAARAVRSPQNHAELIADACYVYTTLGRVDEANRLGREFLALKPDIGAWVGRFRGRCPSTRSC
jgi:hypothetical protein